MAPVISLRELLFRWPSATSPCLEIDQLEVFPGEQIFLHGPSGCGKSTLLGILGGLHQPQLGCVDVLGTALYHLNGSERDRFRVDHIGFLFQQFNLIPYLSMLDNVQLPCRFSKLRRKNLQVTSLSDAQRLLSQLDLSPELWSRPVTDLSVGQQQRVAAARALIGRPEIIIADEPTSSLDADRQIAFLELLKHECAESGSTLIFVSHDKRLAEGFSREIALPSINRAIGYEPGEFVP